MIKKKKELLLWKISALHRKCLALTVHIVGHTRKHLMCFQNCQDISFPIRVEIFFREQVLPSLHWHSAQQNKQPCPQATPPSMGSGIVGASWHDQAPKPAPQTLVSTQALTQALWATKHQLRLAQVGNHSFLGRMASVWHRLKYIILILSTAPLCPVRALFCPTVWATQLFGIVVCPRSEGRSEICCGIAMCDYKIWKSHLILSPYLCPCCWCFTMWSTNSAQDKHLIHLTLASMAIQHQH